MLAGAISGEALTHPAHEGLRARRPRAAATQTVMRASSPERARLTSGSTRVAGASEDHSGEPPPSWAKAKPPTNTGPAAGGRPGSRPGSPATVRDATSRTCRATSPKRPGPAASTVRAAPRPASANPSRSGCSKQKKRSVGAPRGEHRRRQVQLGGDRHGDGGDGRLAAPPGQPDGACGSLLEQQLGVRVEGERQVLMERADGHALQATWRRGRAPRRSHRCAPSR